MKLNAVSSVVNLVDSIIYSAIYKSASDIHLEPIKKNLIIRYRIDGLLYIKEKLPEALKLQIISRIKVLANINIAEKRIPQDGKFRFLYKERFIDLRVSTFPTIYGEKIVIRILDRLKNMIKLEELGLSSTMLFKFKELLKQSSGFILVTGPTGSGKTTTLYAALSELNSSEKNIITLEDPVEYNIDGIIQGQINPDSGFTFSKGIRALLRQDPDIAMIGEIRDKITAETAIEAALTGHIVLSTLHTKNSPGAITRLMDMGIESYLINASLTGVLTQRLSRVICKNCKYKVNPTEEEIFLLKKFNIKFTDLYRGAGCKECFGLGYKGRTGIFELLIVSDKLRKLITRNPSISEIYAQALLDNMDTLLMDGVEKLKNGLISLSELVKAIF